MRVTKTELKECTKAALTRLVNEKRYGDDYSQHNKKAPKHAKMAPQKGLKYKGFRDEDDF